MTLDGFRVRINGRKPDVEVTARIVCDPKHLHVAFVCEEPDLKKALDAAKKDDAPEDSVIVGVDPGLTRARSFTFNLSISGRREGDLASDDWSGRVVAKGTKWIAQIAVPLKALGGAPAEGDVWGIALARCRHGEKRYAEVSSWSPCDLKVANPRDFGFLVFGRETSDRDALRRGEIVRGRLQSLEDARNWRACAALGPTASPREDDLPLEAGAAWDLPAGKAKVTAVDNPRIVRGRFPFTWQDAEEPQLRELRERCDLDRVVSGANDDFEEAIRLQHWTIDHLHFGRPAHHEFNALKLLADAEAGKTFFCTHYSYVFMQVCLAMGIPARKLTTIGHASNEFWSNRYGKWVTIECTRGHYFEKADVPLSALEVHDEVVRNMGLDVDYSRGTERAIRKINLERDKDDKLADAQERYQFFGALMRNDILSVGLDDENFRFVWWRDDHNRDLDAIEIWSNKPPHRFRSEPEEGWEPIYLATEDPDDLYWTLNQAELHASPAADGLRIAVSTVTPWFARFEARIDGGGWTRVDALFDWPLRRGANALEVRPVNAFGRPGIASSLSVELA